MTIDKAILLKESYLRNPLCNLNEEEEEADRMSIEALKSVKRSRLIFPDVEVSLLPGETKD